MKRFFIVIVLTGLVALAIGIVLDIRYTKRWSTLYFMKTDALIRDSTFYDIIYLGNSRVHFGINPYYVDSVTGLSSYNFGVGGSDAQELMMIGNLYLQNHRPPKVVVMSVELSTFAPFHSLKTRYPYLYYLNNDTVYKYMRQAYPSVVAARLLPFFKYSFFDEYNRTSLFNSGKPYPISDHNIYRGFINIHQGENFRQEAVFNVQVTDSIIISADAKNNIENIVLNFLKAGTKVIVISPPEKTNGSIQLSRVHRLRDSMVSVATHGKNVHHFDFRRSSIMENKYFTDDIHLSERGAKVFSIQLADSIKTIL